MLSIALAPDFASTGKLYAFYAGSATGGDLQIDEFTAGGDSADLATRRPVLTIEHSESPEPQRRPAPVRSRRIPLHLDRRRRPRLRERARSSTILLGKVLRIDPRQAGGAPYTVPADNPVRRRRRARRDLELRPAQSLPLLIRPPDGSAGDRRRRPAGAARRSTTTWPRAPAAATTTAGPASRARSTAARPVTESATRSPATVFPILEYDHDDRTARSSAATSPATRASATSSVATSTPTSAPASSARCSPALPLGERRALRGRFR